MLYTYDFNVWHLWSWLYYRGYCIAPNIFTEMIIFLYSIGDCNLTLIQNSSFTLVGQWLLFHSVMFPVKLTPYFQDVPLSRLNLAVKGNAWDRCFLFEFGDLEVSRVGRIFTVWGGLVGLYCWCPTWDVSSHKRSVWPSALVVSILLDKKLKFDGLEHKNWLGISICKTASV